MEVMSVRVFGMVAFIGFVACVFMANWATERWGLIDYPLGLQATAGTVFAGLAFTMRDGTQTGLGRWWAVVAVLVGAALTWFIAPSFAVASAVAFLVSESADFAIYTPLKEREWGTAVLVSNAVGAFVDSWLFLWIAFDLATAREFWVDQTIIKIAMAVPFVLAIWAWRRRDLPVRGERGIA